MINISAPILEDDEIEAVTNVLKSRMLAQGPKVEEFEEAFASYIGTKYAIATNSGTAALHIALLASGIGKGDEIITTPFSFISTANAILFCGAKPVFVDIDENTFNINPNLIYEKITPRTKAILPVHLYGQPCDMKEIVEICNKHNLALIEDACQAHGAVYYSRQSAVGSQQLRPSAIHSRLTTSPPGLSTNDYRLALKVGSFGIGCFSFYPTKNMTTGEGGMITTDDEDVAQKARMIRNHGQKERYFHETLGYNYRMTDIAAALGICQLKKLDEFTRKRIENARFLTKEISSIKGLMPPFVAPNVKHVFHQFTIKVTEDFRLTRDELHHRLSEKGVGSAVYYPLPIHKQPLYQKLGYNDHLPISEKVAHEVLSLPVRPGLREEDLKTIVRAL